MSQLAWSKLYQFLPVFVLPLTFLCLVVLVFEWNKKTDVCSFKLRTAIILGGLLGILWALVGTVILSLLHLLKFEWVLGYWLVSLFYLIYCIRFNKISLFFAEAFNSLRICLFAMNWFERILGLYITTVLGCAFLMALYSPPNNNDSMIYHLPRQILWMSNASVFISEAPNIFMLKWPPLSEYLGVNLWILADSDRLHNLVQWIALIGCLLVLNMILELLGASKGFLTSSAILVSIPAVFYQASNTKNDIQVGFLLLCLIWLTEVAVKKRTVSSPLAIFTGIAVGFCLMAKGTSLIYLTVLLPILLFRLFANRVSLHFAPILSAVLISIVIASPHYIPHTKNILAGDTGENSEHKNAKINIQNAVSVLSKNVALQMALPWPSWNAAVKNGVEKLHQKLGVRVNSPETSFYDQPFDVIYWPNSEDNVTSILAILIIILLPFVFIYQLIRGRKVGGFYYFLPVMLLLIFSILLKWQPWHTRLLIPIEIVAGIPIGIVMASGISVLAKIFLVGFSAWWFFPCLKGWHRPLLGYQPVFLMQDLDQRAMKAPREAFDTIALSEILAQLKPQSLRIDNSFYPPLVYMGRDSRAWPRIYCSQNASEEVDATLRTIPAGQSAPPLAPDMIRLYESGFACLDVKEKIINHKNQLISPVFTGMKKISGMDEPIGPFALAKQPIFCHAHYPEVSFEIPARSATGIMRVEMTLPYFNKLDENLCEIFVNGKSEGQIFLKKVKKGKARFTKSFFIPPGELPTVVKLVFENFATDSESKIAASITAIRVSDAEP
jgi:hypothetical protein